MRRNADEANRVCGAWGHPLAVEYGDGGGRSCPVGQVCFDTGVSPAGGYRDFDSVLYGLVTLLQVATLDRWSSVLYELIDGVGYWVIAPILLVVLSSTGRPSEAPSSRATCKKRTDTLYYTAGVDSAFQ